jgi:hypothetical protein
MAGSADTGPLFYSDVEAESDLPADRVSVLGNISDNWRSCFYVWFP